MAGHGLVTYQSLKITLAHSHRMSLSATYYEIDVSNTIIEPSGQFVINDCYNSAVGTSSFCSRITRDLSDPTSPLIDNIDLGFLNRDNEKARGVDVNIAYDDQFTLMDRPIDFAFDLRANRQLERSDLFLNDDGSPDFDTDQGEFGYPTWTTQAFFRFDYDKYRVTWETRYMSGVEQDSDFVDDFDDVFGGGSDACLGPPDDVLCRDIGFAENYFLHNVSLYYYGDRWTFGGGIRNLLDEEPPFVDGSEVLSVNNSPIGYGYDLNGRVFFLNASVNFAGGQ